MCEMTKAQWSGDGDGFDNQRVRVNRMYLPLVMTALSGWSHHRLYLPWTPPSCGTGTA